MSTDIYIDAGLIVTHKAGPASEGEDRARWQFTCPVEGHVTLTRDQVLALVDALIYDARVPDRYKRNG